MEHMSDILFIRHAETDMAGTFCGHSDPELNARGRAQLDELTNRLRGEKIDVVYSSDLRRAETTARAIATSFAVACHVRPALREIYFGQWESLTWSEIEQRDRNYAQHWLAAYPNLAAPEGETFCDFERRVLEEVDSLSMMAAGCSIVVVSHGGVLRTVLRRLCGYSETDAWEQTQAYGAIVRYAIPTPSAEQLIEVRS
jgi:alpha-ribazole phosphatase